MCKFVTGRLDLGKTRIAGYTAYDSKSKNILELVPTEAKSLVERGELYGLIINEQGELIPDKEGFAMNNLFIKSGVGNWRTMYDNDGMTSEMFILVRVITSGEESFYELVNNRGGRIIITEELMRARLALFEIGGCVMDNGKIKPCKGVILETITVDTTEPELKLLHQSTKQTEKQKAAPKPKQAPKEQEEKQ